MNQDINAFLKAALECSVLVNPLEPGLTRQELGEIGRRAGYQDGEINDALPHVTTGYFGVKKLLPSSNDRASWSSFFPEDPEYRNFAAFDFVVTELNALTRSEGSARALIERGVLVERAVAKGIPRNDIQVAITWQVMAEQLTEKDGILRFPGNHGGARGLASEQLNALAHMRPHSKPNRARAFPIVKDVVERRTDGRPKHAEPLDAFAEELDKLGYSRFRLWWTLTVAELQQINPNSAPVSASVLAAALVEGALTLIVSHARKRGQFQSKGYEREPHKWRIDDLVASAASGGPSAVLDLQIKARVETLIRSRQRIHAGRMLSESEYPSGPPDIRPEEARDAKGTAEQVVRAILDWLQKNPASP
jgi:hypothetical protein